LLGGDDIYQWALERYGIQVVPLVLFKADVRDHYLKHPNIDLNGDGILKNRDSLLFTTSYTEIEISNSPIGGDKCNISLDELQD